MRATLLVLAMFLGACAGQSGRQATTAKRTSAFLKDERPLVSAGPRCAGGTCRCREVDAQGATTGDASEGAPAEGMKRFELRTGRGNDEVQVTVEGRGTLHKSREAMEVACGYVDLPAGEHRVRLRVTAPPGQMASPRLFIYEHGARTGSWYATFAMSCGSGAACTRPELEERIAELRRPRGLFDPCGSVQVGGIRYEADRDAEDRVTALDLELVLKVYKFAPRFPRGGTCRGLSGE